MSWHVDFVARPKKAKFIVEEQPGLPKTVAEQICHMIDRLPERDDMAVRVFSNGHMRTAENPVGEHFWPEAQNVHVEVTPIRAYFDE